MNAKALLLFVIILVSARAGHGSRDQNSRARRLQTESGRGSGHVSDTHSPHSNTRRFHPPRYHHHLSSTRHHRRSKTHLKHPKKKGTVKRHARYHSSRDSRRNHGTYSVPFVDMFMHQSRRSPHWQLRQLQDQHHILLSRLRSHMNHQVARMRERITPLHRQHHSQHRLHSSQHQRPKHRQDYPRERQNHYLHPHSRVNHRQQHHPQHLSRLQHHHHQRPSPHTQSRRNELPSRHTRDRKQFKIFRGPTESIPEDVEVFRGPHRNTVVTTVNHGSKDSSSADRDNCTVPVNRGDPFHHTIFKSTSSPRGGSGLKPVNRHPTHGHRFTPTSTRPSHGHPLLDPLYHLSRFQHGSKILNSILPLIESSLRPARPHLEKSSLWQNSGNNKNAFRTNVQDHLDTQSSVNRERPRQKDDIPCIKCPPDAHVKAPRGRDCVYAQAPSPLSCTPRWWPDVRTVVTEGPTPGTRLQEGNYVIVFTVVSADAHSSLPITICRINYNVEVRKCPELPKTEGLEVTCTAGRAWGSRCSWRCVGGLKLQGAASTTCMGHHHLHWSHPPPMCIGQPSSPPLRRRSCTPPREVLGGYYVCEPPKDPSRSVPIPKDEPVRTRYAAHSRRDVGSADHREGTVCRLQCGRGWVIAASQRGRSKLTCTPGGHWDPRPPACVQQVAPVLQPGECEDEILTFPHLPLSFLPLPTFITASSVPAHVSCVLETRTHGQYTRTCTAKDPELETSAHCKYRIVVTGETQDPDTDIPDASGSQDQPNHFAEEDGRDGDTGDDSEDDEDETVSLSVSEESTVDGGITGEASGNEAVTPPRKTDTDLVDEDYDNSEEDEYDYYGEGDYDDEEYTNHEFDYYYDANDYDDEEEYDGKYDNGTASLPVVRSNDASKSPQETWVEQVGEDSRRKQVGVIKRGSSLYGERDLGGGEDIRSTVNRREPEINAGQIESISPETHFPRADSMPKMMEEDMSDLLPFFHEKPNGETDVSKRGFRRGINEVQKRSREHTVSDRRGSQQASGYSNSHGAEDRKQEFSSTSNEGKIANSNTRSRGNIGRVVNSIDRRIDDTKILELDAEDANMKGPWDRTKTEGVLEHGGLEEYEMRVNKRKKVTSHDSWGTEAESYAQHAHTTRRSVMDGDSNALVEDSGETNSKKEVEEEGTEEAESQPATMEALFKMKVHVRDCSVVGNVAKLLQKALLEQVSCKALICHPPHVTCNHSRGHEGERTLGVMWSVGGPYEPLDDYYYDDQHVPEVETGISAVLESTRKLLRSKLLRRSLWKMEATVDLPSFTLTHLDLICRQPGHGVDQRTNRCRECPTGTYSHEGTCVPCAPGTYMDQAGRSTCVPCREGTLAPRPGMTQCLPLGADHEVQQVKGPHVVQHPLGPLMEVSHGYKQPGSFREQREANMPAYRSGCLSCTLGGSGGYSSSSRSSSYSTSSYGGTGGRTAGNLHVMGSPSTGPHSSSTRKEFRTEKQYLNGQPVYHLEHEVRYEDGRLVHDKLVEKDEDDLGYVPEPEVGYGGLPGSYYTQPGYGGHRQESFVQGQTYRYGSESAHGSDDLSSNLNSEVARMEENLRRRMMYGSRQPPHGGSRRTEVRYQTRYVNGKPVYVKNEERKYENGQLVHNRTEEKGPEDLGTDGIAHRYDSSGAVIGSGGYYNQHQEGYEQGSHSYPRYRPTYSYETEERRQSSSSYPSHVQTSSSQYGEDSRQTSHSSYPTYRPSYGSLSTRYNGESRYSSTHPVYRPYISSQTQQTGETQESSSYYPYSSSSGRSRTQETVETQESSPYYPYRPSYGSSRTQETEETQESSPRYPYRPSSGSSRTQETEETQESSPYYPYRPSSGSSRTEETEETQESSPYYPYRPSYGSSRTEETEETQESSSYYPYRPSSGSSRTEETEETQESSPYYPYRPSSGSSRTEETEETQESSPYYPYRTSSGSSRTEETEETQESSPYYPYGPSSGSSQTQESEETLEISSPYTPSPTPESPRPVYGISQTQEGEKTQESASYYPRRPVPESPQTQPTEEVVATTTPYPSYRREHAGSATHYTEGSVETSTSSNRQASGRYSPSYRPDSRWPNVEGSTTYYSEESHRSSPSHVDVTEQRRTSSQRGSGTASEDMGATLVRQNVRNPSPDYSITRIVQESAESAHTRESTHTYASPDSTSRSSGGYSDSQSEAIEEHYPLQPTLHSSGDGARTHTVDLTSSSASGSSLSDQLLGHGRTDHRTDTQEGELRYSGYDSRRFDDDISAYNRQHVGIPGVISGPMTSEGDDDAYNKERYDISPLEDGYVRPFPEVDNEVDSSLIPTLPSVDNEIDSSMLGVSGSNDGSPYGTPRDSSHGVSSGISQTGPYPSSTGGSSSSSTYYYNSTHTRQGNVIGQAAPAVGRTRYDSTGTSTSEGSLTPSTSGASYYHYNESRSHSTVSGSHRQLVPGSSSDTTTASSTTNCVQSSGCVPIGSPQSSSRRTEYRTTRRYVNGRLVGLTHHQREYENGELVHENVTDHGRDELDGMDLSAYGGNQLELAQGTYHPGSYSQQHEVRQEEKYVNGQQVYDLHHEKRFEDGHLVYDNRTEKNEDDLGVAGQGGVHLGVGSLENRFGGGENRHEVTQTQQTQQHTTSGRVTGAGVGRSSQTHQVSEGTRVLVVPQYSSRRYEERREQEFVDGHPVYDLHHERRFHNGSLVYENRTELDESDLSGGGHADALHNILAGNTLNTALDSSNRAAGSYGSYDRSQEASQSSGYYGGGSVVSQTSESHGASSVHGSLETQRGSGTVVGGATSEGYSTGRSGATTTILGGSDLPLTGSDSTLSGSTGYGGGSYGSSSAYNSESYSSSSHRQDSTGGVMKSGCLSCVLLAGSGYANQDAIRRASGSLSRGMGGTGGYSHKQEMSREEHYEDGQLLRGREESRRYRDGQLVQEDRREYSDVPGQVTRSLGLDSAGTSYTSSSSSSSSSSEASVPNLKVTIQGSTTGHCDPNPCQHGGTCLAGLHGPICACRFGFRGSLCMELDCPRGFCRYDGQCSIEDGVHVCACKSGYSGHRCEKRNRRHSKRYTRRHATKP